MCDTSQPGKITLCLDGSWQVSRQLKRRVATTEPGTLRVLRMVSPGMIQRPTAAIAICIDRALAAEYGFGPDATTRSSTSARPQPR